MRPDFNTFYMNLAKAIRLRGDCRRTQVGCVIVNNQSIVAASYNGFPPDQPGCLEDGACPRAFKDNVISGQGYAEDLCYIQHAESNALLRAGRERTVGAELFCTKLPCQMCHTLILSAGVRKVLYLDENEQIREMEL